MRKVSITLSVFVLLAMLLTACGGQQTSTTVPATNVPPVTIEVTSTSAPTTAPEMTTTAAVPVTGAENPSRLSNELKFSVVDQSGNKLGDVTDMVIDLDNTRVSYVVMGSSSGTGSVLIPWDSLKLQTGTSSTTTGSAQNAFVLQADAQVLQNAPTTDLPSVMPAMGQAAGSWDKDIQNYWLSGGSTTTGTATSAPAVSSTSTSTSGAGTGTGSGTATEAPTSTSGTGTGSATAAVAPTSTTGTGSDTGTGTGQVMPVQGVALASQIIGTTISLRPGQGNGTGTSTGTGAGTGTATEAPTSTGGTGTGTATEAPTSTSGTGTGTGTATEAATSTSGTGTGTGNGLGNLQATIDDMIVETNTGMIQYLVVRTDLGSGEVLVPVPLNLVEWDPTNKGFMLNVAPGILQSAPNFTSDQFPDTSTSGWDQQFSTFWQSNGGSGTGTGTGANATATP